MPIRDAIKPSSPMWLQDGQAERYMFNFGLSLDVLLEKVTQGIHDRMPTLCDPTALPIIGGDRLIPQGASETDDNYRLRLQAAFDAWQTAGTPWAILRQTLLNLLSLKPAARLVADRYAGGLIPATISNSKWDTYAAGADVEHAHPTHTVVAPGNWDWDSVVRCPGSYCWSRFWFILESVGGNAWCTNDSGTWGEPGDTWGDLIAWGTLDTPSGIFDALWDSILLWKDANAPCVALIVSFDATHFDPGHAAGGGVNPDGTYGRWSTMSGNVQVPTRTAVTGARFSHRIE